MGRLRKRADEFVGVAGRLLREDVDRGAEQVAGFQGAGQGVDVDDAAARGVDQIAALLHRLELIGADHVAGLRGVGHVQADHVGQRQQFVQRPAGLGIAERQLLLHVEEAHAHAERFGDDGKLGADMAVADDAEHLAPDLVAVLGRLHPAAFVDDARLVPDPAHQHDDLAHHQFGDAAGIAVRRVEHRNAESAGHGQVDLIGADAEAADGHQLVGFPQHLFRKLGARADAKHVDAGQPFDQVLFIQRLGQAGDVGIAVIGQIGDGVIVNPLEQKDRDLFLGERQFRHFELPYDGLTRGGPAMSLKPGRSESASFCRFSRRNQTLVGCCDLTAWRGGWKTIRTRNDL